MSSMFSTLHYYLTVTLVCSSVLLPGTYSWHIQCQQKKGEFSFWSFTTVIIKLCDIRGLRESVSSRTLEAQGQAMHRFAYSLAFYCDYNITVSLLYFHNPLCIYRNDFPSFLRMLITLNESILFVMSFYSNYFLNL